MPFTCKYCGNQTALLTTHRYHRCPTMAEENAPILPSVQKVFDFDDRDDTSFSGGGGESGGGGASGNFD